MTSLKDQMQADLTSAMKSEDELTKATLRMALAAVTNAEVSGKQARQLSDDEVVGVLAGEAKKRREAAQSYDDAGAPERAARERAELGVLERYLPQQLSDEELDAMVQEAVAQAAAGGQAGPAAMGAVMKVLQPATRGRADGAVVAAKVRSALQS